MGRGGTHEGLALLYVFFLEEELAVEVGEVDGVEVEQGDVAEAGEHDVFHCAAREAGCVRGVSERTEFAADAACADEEDVRVREAVVEGGAEDGACVGGA